MLHSHIKLIKNAERKRRKEGGIKEGKERRLRREHGHMQIEKISLQFSSFENSSFD